MTARKVKAEYRNQVLPEYQDNPLIMALPDIMSVPHHFIVFILVNNRRCDRINVVAVKNDNSF